MPLQGRPHLGGDGHAPGGAGVEPVLRKRSIARIFGQCRADREADPPGAFTVQAENPWEETSPPRESPARKAPRTSTAGTPASRSARMSSR